MNFPPEPVRFIVPKLAKVLVVPFKVPVLQFTVVFAPKLEGSVKVKLALISNKEFP